jgi:hypothetical protein
MAQKTELKKFGWQGFVLEIPQGCRFLSESGTSHSGYVRFDAGKFQFELKWDPLSSKSENNPFDIAEALVQQIGKKAKREPKKHGKSSMRVNGHEAVLARFSMEKENHVVVWVCQQSKRVVMVQFVFSDSSPEQKDITQLILDSVECHNLDGDLWSVLGFSLSTPKSFNLKKRRLIVGRSTLSFTEEKRIKFRTQKTQLIFECFSLANVQFKETYVHPHKWIEEYYMNELGREFNRMEMERCSNHRFHSHRLGRCVGKASFHVVGLRNVLLNVAAWYCEDSARIYALTAVVSIEKIPFTRGASSEDLMKLHKSVLSTVVCH